MCLYMRYNLYNHKFLYSVSKLANYITYFCIEAPSIREKCPLPLSPTI